MAECIERDVVMKEIMARKWMDGYDGAMAMEIAASAPAADVAPVVHGRWEWFNEETGTPFTKPEGWRCSRCKYELPDDYDDPDCRPMLDYCPNCGAKMDMEDGGADK